MTIRLLRPFDGYPINAVVSLGAATETALVNQYGATTDLTGGFVYNPNNPNSNNQNLSNPVPSSYMPPPTRVVALAGNRSARVYWASPTGGGAFRYKVTSSPGGLTAEVDQSTLPNGSVTITGLANGVSYTFSVVAYNGFSSSSSQPSNAVTPTATPSTVLPVSDGLAFWWSAGNITNAPADGSELTLLTDLSGNGFNMARAAGAGTGGTWRTNLNSINAAWTLNRRGVQLNGTNQYYFSDVTKLYPGKFGTEQTIYVAYGVQAAPNTGGNYTQCVISNGDGGNNVNTVNNNFFELRTDGGGSNTAGAMFNAGATVTSTVILTPPTAPQRAVVSTPGEYRLNGSVIGSGPSRFIYPITETPLTANAFCVGCRNQGGFNRHLNGIIAEVIIFNQRHTASQIALMESYLSGVI